MPAASVWRRAERFLPESDVRGHNLALMDVGAMLCKPKDPQCGECPLANGCRWRLSGYPEPRSNRRAKSVRFEETARFARGRIVDALRNEHALGTEELEDLLPEYHRAALPRYLLALAEEGLIERGDYGWQLPGHGNSNIASPKL